MATPPSKPAEHSSRERARVLLVEDDEAVGELLSASLDTFEVVFRRSAEEALTAIDRESFDAVVTDLYMPGMNGIELCERIAQNRPDLPVIVLTAHGRLDTAVAAIRAGAYDFLVKPPAEQALALALERAVRHRALHAEVKRLRDSARAAAPFDGVLGQSAAMQKVYDLLERIAEAEATILLTGESGTGKEAVARAIHRRSKRAAGPFVAVNCAAMPEALLESELFGHAKGAFTDAKTARTGLFAQANGGTLFLDEIGEMPIGLQPKLLRALQERVVRPVGASKEQPIDVRVLAATNVDLQTAMAEKRFREDLYFRISVIQVELPPLRARGNDVLLLAQYFVEHFARRTGKAVKGVAPATAQKLLAYAWPGNVRELQNCIERAVVLTNLDHLSVDDLPEKLRAGPSAPLLVSGDDAGELVTMEEIEKRYIKRVLEVTAGNKTVAARVLGFDRTTLYRKMERYGFSG